MKIKKNIAIICFLLIALGVSISESGIQKYFNTNCNVYAADVKEIKDEDKEFKKKEEVDEWAKKAELKVEKTDEQAIKDYIEDNDNLRTNYKRLMYGKTRDVDTDIAQLEKTYGEDIPKDILDLKKIVKLEDILKNAKFKNKVVVYDTIAGEDLGFTDELIVKASSDENSDPKVIVNPDFIQKYKDKTIKLDRPIVSDFLIPGDIEKKQVVLKLTVPGSSNFPVKAGIVASKDEYKLLVDNGYGMKVTSIVGTPVKGTMRVVVNAELVDSIDFKSDLDRSAGAWGKEKYKGWYQELNADQQKAISLYAKRDYQTINSYLRNPNSKPDEALDKEIKDIEDALKSRPLDQNLTVYRRCGLPEFGYKIDKPYELTLEDFKNKFLGKIITNAGFTSTALSSAAADTFAKNRIILKIQVPKGSAGAFLIPEDIQGYAEEQEFLMNRGMTYRIDSVTKVAVSDNMNSKLVDRIVANATVVKDLTAVEAQDATVYVGNEFDPQSLVKKSIGADGKETDNIHYSIDNTDYKPKEEISLDTSAPRDYKVKLMTQDANSRGVSSNEVTIHVKEDQTKLEAQDVTVYIGDEFDPQSVVKTIRDKEGKETTKFVYSIDKGKQQKAEEVSLDTSTPRDYKVKLTTWDANEKEVESNEIIVHVKEDPTIIEAQDVTLYVGDKFDPQSVVKSSIGADGKETDNIHYSIDDTEYKLKEELSLDTSIPRDYKVNLVTWDHNADRVYSEPVTIHVISDSTTIEAQDVTLYVGQKFDPKSVVKTAIGPDGKETTNYLYSIDGGNQQGAKDVSIDTSKAKDYKVKLMTWDANAKGVDSNIVIVHVKEDETKLEAQDVTLYVGQKFDPQSVVKSSIGADGKETDNIHYSIDDTEYKLKEELSLDTSIPRDYKVNLVTWDHNADRVYSEPVTIHIISDSTTIEAQDVTLYVGDKFDLQSVVKTAIGPDGKETTNYVYSIDGGEQQEAKDVSIDTSKEGYHIVQLMTWDANAKRIDSDPVLVHVKEDETTLKAQDVTLYVGDKFDPQSVVKTAVGKDGEKTTNYIYSIDGNSYQRAEEISLDTSTRKSYKVQLMTWDHKGGGVYSNTVTVKVTTDVEMLDDSQVKMALRFNNAHIKIIFPSINGEFALEDSERSDDLIINEPGNHDYQIWIPEYNPEMKAFHLRNKNNGFYMYESSEAISDTPGWELRPKVMTIGEVYPTSLWEFEEVEGENLYRLVNYYSLNYLTIPYIYSGVKHYEPRTTVSTLDLDDHTLAYRMDAFRVELAN